MLKVPQLNDMTYEQIIQRAVSRIPSLTDQWTDFNSHDPGITVLQTYAWLVDMLNYYMDATGDVHVKKYLKLLGIQQQKRRAAAGYVVIHGDVQQEIPKEPDSSQVISLLRQRKNGKVQKTDSVPSCGR